MFYPNLISICRKKHTLAYLLVARSFVARSIIGRVQVSLVDFLLFSFLFLFCDRWWEYVAGAHHTYVRFGDRPRSKQVGGGSRVKGGISIACIFLLSVVVVVVCSFSILFFVARDPEKKKNEL